jgi:hypothetical protein
MNFYTCSVCHNLNGSFRLHCQVCGAVPEMYSIWVDGKNIMAARGVDRQESHHATRLNLRTVEYDYYAGA